MTGQAEAGADLDLPAGRPVVVISPHLDDAVFSCGELLAARPGSLVVTALAGRPPAYDPPTSWDALAGFRAGEDVVAARRQEDRAALGLLGAHPCWLDFLDSQYHHSPSSEELAAALDAAVSEAGLDAVFLPLGLFHSDHHLTHAAAVAVLRRRPAYSWFAYEDALYRQVPNLGAERLLALEREGVVASPAGTSSGCGREAKRRAMQQYRSQLRALAAPGKPGSEDALEPERYWRLALAAPASRG